MVLLPLFLLLSTSLLLGGTQDRVQAQTLHPELIAGPWETVSASGSIDGVFFQIVTSSSSPVGRPQITGQTVDIRVYHRQERNETGGWFGTEEKATPELYYMQDDHSFTLFDGEHLRIHFIGVSDDKPFDLDATFSPVDQAWTGTWSHSSRSQHVVLVRPSPNTAVRQSAFVGDWQDEASKFGDSGTLHIRQSGDDVLSAWLDRTSSGADGQTVGISQRNGEFLQAYSIPGTGLILETAATIGPAFHYRAKLSEDWQTITGTWSNGSAGLSAPDKFRRVRLSPD
jgi:hypothetical protein